jgi:hypothetical protein
MYSSPTSGLLKPINIVKENLLKLKLPKPSIHGSKKQYVSLIHRLLNNHMITLSLPSDVKVINGLFTVTKDATSTRMIVDARYANTYFIDPPSVHLPTPASFISLSLPHGSTLYKIFIIIYVYQHGYVNILHYHLFLLINYQKNMSLLLLGYLLFLLLLVYILY